MPEEERTTIPLTPEEDREVKEALDRLELRLARLSDEERRTLVEMVAYVADDTIERDREEGNEPPTEWLMLSEEIAWALKTKAGRLEDAKRTGNIVELKFGDGTTAHGTVDRVTAHEVGLLDANEDPFTVRRHEIVDIQEVV